MENKKYYTSGECAKALGVTKDTIRRWDKKGILKPTYIVPNTGWRMYTAAQIQNFIEQNKR